MLKKYVTLCNIKHVKEMTLRYNKDNLLRTKAYGDFFIRNNEIYWAYLASMVSRNAGWNMSDLWSRPYQVLLTKEQQNHLFTTYERANWLIFSDAFPQLLIYEWSKKLKEPLFYLLTYFKVSKWMINEWEAFWETGNKERLLQALIINEQNLIQRPVIEAPFFKREIFNSFSYVLQERLHFSSVLFPTKKGQIYGRTVKQFNKVEKRIQLGKELAWILFHSREKNDIHSFFNDVPFSGSRRDYQKWQKGSFPFTPRMNDIYPYILHSDDKREDWSKSITYDPTNYIDKKMMKPMKYDLTGWYEHKQKQIVVTASLYLKLKNLIHK
ncbi:DUF2515 domain-containing protein [Evansella cellulosilytica]|uniref:DUF2515 domain-containing protein n=1 Tax=Evansella cellulosilytica (strain ATCC 21833 / DSM 2522 / FERM P-1141 / JCM 9156 / N-4) TaxID=649639 RepID=E6TZK6_EVAC2|nr:DUF2515 domain-containing protein [Evansella cellulosilytica]ADU30180.1 Protein of unknown function DUF2515 [Evansella cellulosilytica DSM 2522]